MKRGRFDIETDGLLDTVTRTHILTVKINGDKTKAFVGAKEIRQGLKLLDTCDVIVAHNGIAFDLIVLWKEFKWKPKAKIEDSFLVACLLHPDILGGNSLEEWGVRVGEPKMDYKTAYIEWRKQQDETYKYTAGDEWVEYNPVMHTYCVQDTETLAKVDDQLLLDRQGWDWQPALDMEHQFAKDFAVQGLRGVMVDRAKAEALVASIDAEMAEIARQVEPLLPTREGTKGQLKECRPPKLCFKKNGEPTKATLEWFDAVEFRLDPDPQIIQREYREGEAVEFDSALKHFGLKFGVWHKLPTPMEDDQSERKPLKTEFPCTLADQQHIKTWLMDMGWRPTMWNFKKQPDKHGKLRFVRGDGGELVPTWPKFHDKGQLCENLESITSEFEHVRQVVRWVVIRHRRGFVQSIIDHIRADGTVSATGFSLGTPTSRVTHKVVANAPKADPEVVLGKECRSIFIARRGRKLVGVDASGLELRCLAHYVGSPELTDIIVNGTKENGNEIHTVLWRACDPLVPSRTVQKNVTYGWLYGASDKKLGQTAGHADGVAEKVGAEIRRRMVAAIPGLDKLMKKIERAAKVGYIKAIDGRRIEIRSKHATLNTLLQSCGSILVKMAQCYMNQQIRKKRLDAWQVISYHDEVQLDAHPKHAQEAGALFVEGLKWAGKHVGFRVPLDGEVKIGNNWADTH